MPYVARDATGRISALHRRAAPQAQELLDWRHEDVREFLSAGGAGEDVLDYLRATDGELTRVVEDLVDVLVSKHVIAFTDLPPAAREKLERRARARSRLVADGSDLFLTEDDIL